MYNVIYVILKLEHNRFKFKIFKTSKTDFFWSVCCYVTRSDVK